MTPRAVLDAGGEAWETLVAAIGSLVDEIAAGAVLEIVSLEQDIRSEITAWCGAAGHEVLAQQQDGQATLFRIRKGNSSR